MARVLDPTPEKSQIIIYLSLEILELTSLEKQLDPSVLSVHVHFRGGLQDPL